LRLGTTAGKPLTSLPAVDGEGLNNKATHPKIRLRNVPIKARRRTAINSVPLWNKKTFRRVVLANEVCFILELLLYSDLTASKEGR
jgi:hypothetical protein